MLEDIQKVAIIGAGIMGHGIAQSIAMAGYSVLIEDLDEGILVQEYQEDSIWGDIDSIKSVVNTLEYVKSGDSVYLEGVITLTGAIEANESSKICGRHETQKLLNISETNDFVFFVPFGSGNLNYLEMNISFDGNPSSGLFNLGSTVNGYGFRKFYLNSSTTEFSDATGGSLTTKSGWIDISSNNSINFENSFSITDLNDAEYTGYINVNISELNK